MVRDAATFNGATLKTCHLIKRDERSWYLVECIVATDAVISYTCSPNTNLDKFIFHELAECTNHFYIIENCDKESWRNVAVLSISCHAIWWRYALTSNRRRERRCHYGTFLSEITKQEDKLIFVGGATYRVYRNVTIYFSYFSKAGYN